MALPEPGKLTGKIKGFMVGEEEGRGRGGGLVPWAQLLCMAFGESFSCHQVAGSVDLGLKPCLPSHYPCGPEVFLGDFFYTCDMEAAPFLLQADCEK